jgi:uncharacterized protein (TIGR02271 family)
MEGRTVEPAEGESLGDRIARFFGGGGKRSLYDELVRHGVASSEARRLDHGLFPNSAILTVDGANHPELAAELIEEAGGQVVAGEHVAADEAGAAAESEAAVTREFERGSQALGYRGRDYARGEQIDEDRRLQLRAERLDVAKQRVASGEAQVGKDVVERTEELDVPTIREELFIERRSASGEVAAETAGEIGAGETIRIPLMRENVVVTKRPVVTGEYVIGKRTVSDTQHVAETLREERLTVNDPTTARTNPPG